MGSRIRGRYFKNGVEVFSSIDEKSEDYCVAYIDGYDHYNGWNKFNVEVNPSRLRRRDLEPNNGNLKKTNLRVPGDGGLIQCVGKEGKPAILADLKRHFGDRIVIAEANDDLIYAGTEINLDGKDTANGSLKSYNRCLSALENIIYPDNLFINEDSRVFQGKRFNQEGLYLIESDTIYFYPFDDLFKHQKNKNRSEHGKFCILNPSENGDSYFCFQLWGRRQLALDACQEFPNESCYQKGKIDEENILYIDSLRGKEVWDKSSRKFVSDALKNSLKDAVTAFQEEVLTDDHVKDPAKIEAERTRYQEQIKECMIKGDPSLKAVAEKAWNEIESYLMPASGPKLPPAKEKKEAQAKKAK